MDVTIDGQPLETILRRLEVEKRTGLSRSTIYEMMSKGLFPKPVPITGKAVGWLASEIADWQRLRIAKRQEAA